MEEGCRWFVGSTENGDREKGEPTGGGLQQAQNITWNCNLRMGKSDGYLFLLLRAIDLVLSNIIFQIAFLYLNGIWLDYDMTYPHLLANI